ncbi:MAG TPA: type II secretion system protein GspG [Planctomycetaceae bacterium]|jgi:general secretion pathway protein G|nr:type II secretion system protein GspG [Planctomycetaceae bacterium]
MSDWSRGGKIPSQVVQFFLGLVAAIVCALVFFELFFFLNTRYDYDVRHKQARRRLSLLREQIESYRALHGVLPTTLMDLYVPLPEEVIPDDQHVQYHHFGYDGRFNVDGQPLDPWGFPYRYAATNATVELYTTGADGAPGGVGIYADLSSDDPPDAVNSATFAQRIWDPDPARRTRVLLFSLALWGGMMLFMYCVVAAAAVRTAGSMPTSREEHLRVFAQALATLVIVTVIIVLIMVALGSAHDTLYFVPAPQQSFVDSWLVEPELWA